MKILTLNLEAFGPFTDQVLDLSAGSHGLHLIHGRNEAGKTSALRAVRQLFFGIPGQSADNFIHNYKNMRLRASLEQDDGTRLEFVRFKRTKNPLVRPDGVTPLDHGELDRFLAGVDQDLFSTLFGIDHETLVEGGQEIAEGGGRLGNVLFAASSGISNLRGLQQKLQAEIDDLFKASGRVQRISRHRGVQGGPETDQGPAASQRAVVQARAGLAGGPCRQVGARGAMAAEGP